MNEPPTPPTPPGEPHDESRDSKDADTMATLLKRSMAARADTDVKPDLLLGVQRKIRQRSRGKFFADGWSTGTGRVHYGLVALVMLLVIVVAYFALGPVGISAR